MNIDDFQKLVREEFRFLLSLGFTVKPLEPGSIYVTYMKDDFAIELKWEDRGTYIASHVYREKKDGLFDLNAFLELLRSDGYRRCYPEDYSAEFTKADAVRYLARSLKSVINEFWENREALWNHFVEQLRIWRDQS